MAQSIFANETYDDGSLMNRTTLRNMSLRSNKDGFCYVRRNRDKKIVFAGKYSDLREIHPQLKV